MKQGKEMKNKNIQRKIVGKIQFKLFGKTIQLN